MDLWNDSQLLQDSNNISLDPSAAEVPVGSNLSQGTMEELSIEPRRHLGVWNQVFITSVYIFGIGGNLSALLIIVRKETKRFRKQTLMIKCLSMNDLAALLGSCVLMYVKLYMPSADPRWVCVFRVLWRAFGLGSGCVALVMALDRWLALTHPFTYQKHVTYSKIYRAILGLWSFNLVLVIAPLLGFGLWYDETKILPCVRYRFGTSVTDRAYAYLVFMFGVSMCICIVCCNLSVIRVLCRMGNKMVVTRRYSRASNRSSVSTSEGYNNPTPDELSFARLMAILSIFFVICWTPQLLTIIAAQHSLLPQGSPSYRAADILIAFNFTLDPYIYVILRRRHLCKSRHLTKLGSILSSSRSKEMASPKRSLVNNSSRSSNVCRVQRERINYRPMHCNLDKAVAKQHARCQPKLYFLCSQEDYNLAHRYVATLLNSSPSSTSRNSCKNSSRIQRSSDPPTFDTATSNEGGDCGSTSNGGCAKEHCPLQSMSKGNGVCSPPATPRVSFEEVGT